MKRNFIVSSQIPAVNTEYCLTHQESFQELWPDQWICEACLIEYYDQDTPISEDQTVGFQYE